MTSVYIESTIISYYTARLSRDLLAAAHQEITIEWWEKCRGDFECYISNQVLDEISKGDPQAARNRLQAIEGFPLLPFLPEIQELANEYDTAIKLPERSKTDALHVALAVWHELDYLLTWNCVHIAGGRAQAAIKLVNARKGLATPVICTPEQLLNG